MSLKKKESQATGGLRVAADEPHLVSLGGGRLSTAVTIHHLPIGDFLIGSSPSCGVILNGSGVQPHHCTFYRNEQNEVTLVPEPEARTLIDGNKVIEETVLSQGAMLTFGKSNYLRFNNPAEAQMIKSTMGSNERISMPQIDFTQNSSSSNEGSPEEVYENLNSFLESQLCSRKKSNNENNKFLYDSTNIKNFHSPKVFPADSVTVNAPAKDVLGPKYNNFAKNLPQNLVNYSQNNINDKMYTPKNTESFTANNCMGDNSNPHPSILTKINNNLLLNGGQNGIQQNGTQQLLQNGAPYSPQNGSQFSPQNGSQFSPQNGSPEYSYSQYPTQNGSPNLKLQPVSACYDRYPKPGSYGSLQVFPMNGVNQQLNNEEINAEAQRQRAQIERMREEEMSKIEQERLEEILRMCDDFERQNQSITSSPIVQNRIKTNGSLPRDKKGHYGDHSSSPFSEQNSHQNTFFPNDVTKTFKKSNSGYENVAFLHDRRVEIIYDSPELQEGQQNGFENIYATKKYIPQSPRTKIKTCVSPKRDREREREMEKSNEYDLLVQSFEDKLRLEIKQLRDNKTYEPATTTSSNVVINGTNGYAHKDDDCQEPQSNHINRVSDFKETGLVKGRIKNFNNLTVNIEQKVDERQIKELTKNRDKALNRVRELKTQIAELQRQEEEVFRELDLEKALVSAELSTEHESLTEMEHSLQRTQNKIFRLEAQRNSSRVMQETQQAKLKQSIDVKEDQIEELEKLTEVNKNDGSIRDELNTTIEILENEKKLFEDLEFQYLEDETEWLAHREELHHDLITLKKNIDERQNKIIHLEKETVDNQNNACADTKILETNLLTLLTDLEKSREELKTYETQIFNISGQQISQSDSDDEIDLNRSLNKNDKLMSQSLYGSNEILKIKPKQIDIMSKSVNENMFSNNIEMSSLDNHFSSTPKKVFHTININQDIAKIIHNDRDKLRQAEIIDSHLLSASIDSIDDSSKSSSPGTKSTTSSTLFQRSNDTESDPLLKLKYNLSPDTKLKSSSPSVNLNLSLESDDFEVNPLDKRVPSQDDIDRISKVQLDAPISMQGASYKVKESIKEIERNRQLLLSQQGSNVIEHQRQKMNELKKRSHDEARAQYLQLHNIKNGDESYCLKNTSLEEIRSDKGVTHLPLTSSYNSKSEHLSSPQRHSHPEFDSQHRPLSEISEASYDTAIDKPYKSTTDVSGSQNRLSENGQTTDDSNRNSFVSQNEINIPPTKSRLTSGTKRNTPKSQRPLTRYLPIMSSHLDLRQHVESAGHQITLCPHVHIDSASCRGYLHKLGATFHGWSRRWFVLDRQKRALIYYADKAERKPRGGAYFTTIDDVYLDHLNTSKSGRPHCTFIIKTKKRSYHLQAASDAAARIWIDVIITGAQGNIDY